MIPVEPSYFNYIDAAIILTIAIFVLFGYTKGFVKEFLGLISWCVSFCISWLLCPYVANLFKNLIKLSPLRTGIAFVFAFVVTLMLFLLITTILSDKISESRLNSANKSIGGMFGFVKAFAVLLIICIITMVFSPKGSFMQSINESKLGSFVKDYAIDACDAMKAFLRSDDFQRLASCFGRGGTIDENDRPDSSKEAKQLAEPKISKVIYQKDKNAQKEEGYNARRDAFIRKQAAIGPNHTEKPAKAQKDTVIKKDVTKRKEAKEKNNTHPSQRTKDYTKLINDLQKLKNAEKN